MEVMKRTFIEKVILIAAWLVLIGGIVCGTVVSKCILESNLDMCVPQAFCTFVGSIFCSIIGWAVLLEVIKISDRLRQIEKRLSDKKG